jgi:ring-1,2-phenylacetyl-CoA epoxidase subunit PaaE
VKNIVRETEDAFTYVLENTEGTSVSYRVGQFLTFIFKFMNREVRRSFSLVSSPFIDPDLAVTIKRLENGELSRFLIDHLKTGDVIRSLYPSGRFTIDTDPQNNSTYFFIAAGSGITPIYSLVKTVLQKEPLSRIILLYSNTSEQTTIFYEQLKILAEKFPAQLKCVFLFSQQGQRLSNLSLENFINENLHAEKKSTEFYICGPSAYMRMVILTLTYMGFRKNIHKENFISEQTYQVENFVPRNTSSHLIHIFYHDKNFEIIVPPFKTILDAALEQKIPLPYSCKTGLCSTCAAICKKGKVEMTNNEVLTEKDLKEGWVLTCTGFPLENGTEITFQKSNQP